MAEFLSDVGFNKSLKRQITRGDSEGGSEMPGNMTGFTIGKAGQATVAEADQTRILNTEKSCDENLQCKEVLTLKERKE